MFHGIGGFALLGVFFVCGGQVSQVYSDVCNAVGRHIKAKGSTYTQYLAVTQCLQLTMKGFFIFEFSFNLDVRHARDVASYAVSHFLKPCTRAF